MKLLLNFARVVLSLFAVLFIVSGVLIPSVNAQTPPASTPAATAMQAFGADFSKWQRLEGSVTITQNGAAESAKLQWEAPGNLRLQIAANDAMQHGEQAVVAAQSETRIYDAATKRIKKLPYDTAQHWWSGWNLPLGGPANVLLFGISGQQLATEYSIVDTPAKPNQLELLLLPGQRELISDYVRFGGSGDRIYYAPFKRWTSQSPWRIRLTRDATGKNLTMREELDESGQVLTRTTFTYAADGLPATSTVTDAAARVLSQSEYSLHQRETPFAADAFSFDFDGAKASDQIVEDAQLQPLSAYTQNTASAQFHAGVVLASQAEEVDAALALWGKASAAASRASAPLLATFDAAIKWRETARAAAALGRLSTLLGADSYEFNWRKATLSIQLRDWANAQTALEAAIKARPGDLQSLLSLADVQRTSGDLDGAQKILLQLLAIEKPQSDVQANAAQMLAELAGGDGPSREAAKRALPDTTLWQKLARALIDLEANQTGSFPATDNVAALSVSALAQERAGLENAAIANWEKIVTLAPSPTDRAARLHLMALYAKRGQVAPSLEQFHELSAAVPDLETKQEIQSVLLGAWRKALRQDKLRAALEQRSIATTLAEDDARLWLAFQKNYGAPDEVKAAISNGLSRYAQSPWWRSQMGEWIMNKAGQTADTGISDRLQRDAIDYAEQAIALDPEQPYYAIQRMLILVQRATPITGIIDTEKYKAPRKIADEALGATLAKWPNDPDVQIAVAAARLALEDDGAHATSAQLLMQALRGGTPNALEDRHFIAFSSRQVLASALRRDKAWAAVTGQFDTLFRSSRSADEQLGVGLNYLRILMHRKEYPNIAQLLTYFAHEPWSFEESQQLMVPMVNVVAVKEDILLPTLAGLSADRDPYARYVMALLLEQVASNMRQIAARVDAPLDADRNADAAVKNLKLALDQIEPLATSPDTVLAGRINALLGEQAIARGELEQATTWLAAAVKSEPRDINLRIALAKSYSARDKKSEALAQRDMLLRVLPHNFSTLRRAAILSDKIYAKSDGATALKLARAAMNSGQAAPDVSPADWQISALLVARDSLMAGDNIEANLLYSGLSSDQWDGVDRAVVLIDWEETLRNLGRTQDAATIAAQLEALGLSAPDRNRAEISWDALMSAS